MENADARPEPCVVSLPTGFARKSEITAQITQSFLQLNQPNQASELHDATDNMQYRDC